MERLRTLLEVEAAGSISAAVKSPARQSQFSRQLKELSEYFGYELTARRGKNMKTTVAGKRVASLARQFLTALENFESESRGAPVSVGVGAEGSLVNGSCPPRPEYESVSANLASVDLPPDAGGCRSSWRCSPRSGNPRGKWQPRRAKPRRWCPPHSSPRAGSSTKIPTFRDIICDRALGDETDKPIERTLHEKHFDSLLRSLRNRYPSLCAVQARLMPPFFRLLHPPSFGQARCRKSVRS